MARYRFYEESQRTPLFVGALPDANSRVVSLFWSDVNNGQDLGGKVYFRESHDPVLHSKAANEAKEPFLLYGI